MHFYFSQVIDPWKYKGRKNCECITFGSSCTGAALKYYHGKSSCPTESRTWNKWIRGMCSRHLLTVFEDVSVGQQIWSCFINCLSSQVSVWSIFKNSKMAMRIKQTPLGKLARRFLGKVLLQEVRVSVKSWLVTSDWLVLWIRLKPG